jgi:nucleotide-binding universal stress UspA family protein
MALGVAVPFPHKVTPLFTGNPPVSIDEESRLHLLAHIRRRLQSLPAADDWSKRAVIGWPADVINTVAASWKASLIVLGIGRHRRVDRLFGTETAIAVIKHARTPVLAVNPKARELPVRACAAVDFTEASLSSAVLAGRLLATDGTLTLVHASAFKGMKAIQGDLVDVYRTGVHAKLGKAVAEVRRRARCHVAGVLLEGEPGATILEYANREHCDLISLGGHEQGLIDRILLGSVRTRVLRRAKCSVLIAPPLVAG